MLDYRTWLRTPTRRWRVLAVVPAALVMCAVLIIPAGLGLARTLTGTGGLSFATYQAVFSTPTLGTAFVNIFLLTLISVPLDIALGVGIALLLRAPFRGRSAVRAALLLPWLISPLASGVLWHYLDNGQVGLRGWLTAWLGFAPSSPLALPGTALPTVALIEVWRMAPLAAFLLVPGILAIPQDSWDLATLVGSPPWLTVRVVVLPRIRVLLLTVSLLLVGQSLATAESILILTGGGPGTRTTTPALYSYTLAVSTHSWVQGMAIAWLLVGVVLLLGGLYLWRVRQEVA